MRVSLAIGLSHKNSYAACGKLIFQRASPRIVIELALGFNFARRDLHPKQPMPALQELTSP